MSNADDRFTRRTFLVGASALTATSHAASATPSWADPAMRFPNYWTGRWSASDSLDSSLLPTNGLSTAIPWCAHAHAWPLYCYLRLTQAATSA